jgi:dTDP-4-dehydrorhamnose 3,5-epimerase-like enzyme
MFYIYGVEGSSIRGKHANKNSQFIMICLSGNVKILIDDGKNKETVILNKPDDAIFVPSMTWKEMYDFSNDCVLLVLSDCIYDSEEYIKNYDLFLEAVNNEKK